MTGISTYGQALSQIRLLNEQNVRFSNLSLQLSSGLKTQKFSGLDTNLLASKRARAGLESLDTYINNIDFANRRINAMITTVKEFRAQAENFANALINLSQESVHQEGSKIIYDDPLTPTIEEMTEVGYTSGDPDVDLQILTDLANNIYPFMVDLINTKDGDRFLLGGADTATQPLDDNGLLDANISTLIGNWKDETLPAATNLTSAELISALQSSTTAQDPNAVLDSSVGYSANLSNGNVGNLYVRVDDASEVEYTAFANDQAFRDILVAVSFIKNPDLGPIADVYAEPYTAGDPVLNDPVTGLPLNGAPGDTVDDMKDNFFQVYNALATMVNNALDSLENVEFNLESSRARIDTVRQFHVEEKNALLTTVANIEYADTNEVALQIQQAQIQLESSYRVTALLGELTLSNFI